MNRKHLPFIVLAIMMISIAAGCGKEETEPTPDPVTPQDTTKQDTTTVDTDTVVIPVDSTVYIKWSGTTATVEVNEKLTADITYTVNGGDVVVTNNNTANEFLFVLSGASTNGSFTYNGTFKASFQFNGLELTSAAGGAVDIQCGKRIKLELADGTTNSLTDAAEGEQKAAFNCQGHMEVSGGGSLSVAGNYRHGLRTKEYLYLSSTVGSIAVTSAAADAIHCGEFFQMDGGALTISGMSGDGLQVETDAGSEEALNGQFIMNGGTLNMTMTAQDTKGIRLDIDTLNKFTPEMKILGGTITVNLTSSALGAKAIASDGNITIGSDTTSPTVDVTVAAGVFKEEVDGTEEENRATGIKADNTLLIAGGTTTVTATGKKSRGVRAATLRATGGTLTVKNTGSKSQGIKLDNTFTSEGGTVTGTFKY